MIHLTTSTKLIGAGVLFSLGWIVLAACDCDPSTKEDDNPGFWVACVNNMPALMTYSGNDPTIVSSSSAGNFNPDEYDCSHSGSPQYKNSEASSPFKLGTPSGPGSNRPRDAGPASAYLPQRMRDLPFTPDVPPPGTAPTCSSMQPDVFQTIHTQQSVTRFSTCPFTVKVSIPLNVMNPLQIQVTPDGTQALVTSYGDPDNPQAGGGLSFIDLSTNQVTYTLQTVDNLNGLAISADGSTAYVTNFENVNPEIDVVNIASKTITSTISLGMDYPSGLTLTPDGTQLWVTSPLEGETDVVDLLSQTTVIRLNIGASTDVAFNSTGTLAYITSASTTPGQVVAVNTSTYQTVTTYTVGAVPADISMSYGDRFLVVNNSGDNSVSVIDLMQNKVSTTSVAGVPSGIAFVQ
jgi:hypothetical protein